MEPRQFIEPKEIEIDGMKFIISKIPAIQSQQVYRAIMQEAKNDGDIAMTYLTTPTVLSLLSYAATVDGDEWLPLESENRINVSCSKLATLIKLEAAMIRYNFGFLFDGTLQEVLGVLRDSQQDT
jgi:hypothetical protein